MSKSLSRDHLGFVQAVLDDCRDYYPMLSSGFDRDILRLKSHSEKVGDRVFLIDLPAIGKVLDKALDRGVLPRTGLALTGGINARTTVPRLFQGLWLLIFQLDGCLKCNADPQAIFLLRQILLGQKKFKKECTKDVLYKTVSEYYSVDQELPPPSSIWDGGDPLDWGSARPSVYDRIDESELLADVGAFQKFRHLRLMLDTVQKVCDCVSASLGEFHPGAANFRHGPGATSEYQRGKGYKYLFPNWSARLQCVFPREEYAIANSSILGGGFATVHDLFGNYRIDTDSVEVANDIPEREHHSRLIAVPKTQKAPRLIAAEPTCNQWTQQNVKNYLERQILAGSLQRAISFERQSHSRLAAKLGSCGSGTATLDLSSASDRVSCWLVERAFRGNFSLLRAFAATRTRYVSQKLDRRSPSLHKLRKFSSQGSALTFPVQSILFLQLILGVGCHLTGTRPRDWEKLVGKCRVYGDDLIFPIEWVPMVVEVFTYLHLKVNEDKSFWNGKFRESCGFDAFDGHDVSPAYFLVIPNETALESIATTVASANNFYLKGLWRTAKWIERLVPFGMRKLIPDVPVDSVAFGFYTASGFSHGGKTRWNRDLHRQEYLSLGAKPGKNTKRHEGFANLLQYFTEDPSGSGIATWSSGEYGRSASTIRMVWHELARVHDRKPREENWSAGYMLPA